MCDPEDPDPDRQYPEAAWVFTGAAYEGQTLQEFAEDSASCFRESGACVFETRPILERMAELEEPIERCWNGVLEVYLHVQPGRSYVVAIDPSGGKDDGASKTSAHR